MSDGVFASACKSLLKAPVYAYRYSFKAFVGQNCRHWPSCSEYAIEAIDKNGAWRGFWLMLSRIKRCGPGGTSGVDPVPDIRAERHAFAPWLYGRWTAASLPPSDAPRTEVLKIITHPDAQRRVAILRHPSGGFGFEEEALIRDTHYDDSAYEEWRGVTDDSFAVCDTAETAEREARSRIAWLKALGNEADQDET